MIKIKNFDGSIIEAHDLRVFRSDKRLGEVYPRLQLRIVGFEGNIRVSDETGWDGHESSPDTLLPECYNNMQAALDEIERQIAESERY